MLDEFNACLHGFGLTPFRRLSAEATLFKDREGEIHRIPDTDGFDAAERLAFIELRKQRIGITDH